MTELHYKGATSRPNEVVCAIVVSYQPGEDLVTNVSLISEQVGRVFVVDNGSSDASRAILQEIRKLERVQLIENKENLGIAGGLNVGLRAAIDSGFKWVATFDQDSRVPKDFFTDLLNVLNLYPEPEKVGMLAPLRWSSAPVTASKASGEAPEYKSILLAIASGSLVRTAAFAKAGTFDESLFIDYVDFDFCLKLHRSGYKILGAIRATLCHELGESQTLTFFGRKVLSFRVHSAWRYYYIMRNRILLFRRHGARFPLWVLLDGTAMVLEFGRIILLENGRIQKARCALAGMFDGIRGKSGRHPARP